MSEAASAAATSDAQKLVTELSVSGHLMTLDAGLFCIVQAVQAANARTGLPGVRVSLPPGPGSRPEAVSIAPSAPMAGCGGSATRRWCA